MLNNKAWRWKRHPEAVWMPHMRNTNSLPCIQCVLHQLPNKVPCFCPCTTTIHWNPSSPRMIWNSKSYPHRPPMPQLSISLRVRPESSRWPVRVSCLGSLWCLWHLPLTWALLFVKHSWLPHCGLFSCYSLSLEFFSTSCLSEPRSNDIFPFFSLSQSHQ